MPDVTVIYDFGTSSITVQLFVQDNGSISVIPALAVVPKGTYLMTWSLVLGSGVTASFDTGNGIALDTKPPKVEVRNPTWVNPTTWQATVENDVEGPNVFSYLANLTVNGTPFTTGDPTIAVTNDPPPGG